MFQVEVRVADGSALPDRMEKMRIWLDERHFEPATFRYSFIPNGILFRIDFPAEAEATEFATAFDGSLSERSSMAI